MAAGSNQRHGADDGSLAELDAGEYDAARPQPAAPSQHDGRSLYLSMLVGNDGAGQVLAVKVVRGTVKRHSARKLAEVFEPDRTAAQKQTVRTNVNVSTDLDAAFPSRQNAEVIDAAVVRNRDARRPMEDRPVRDANVPSHGGESEVSYRFVV